MVAWTIALLLILCSYMFLRGRAQFRDLHPELPIDFDRIKVAVLELFDCCFVL